ncbi:glycosyltransferase family 39 protein [Protofrankia symbiont of Coriaria ruscifolia]|uniref:glycosyltransferase family 39 protein n=1 Tax=Protofrankia symbiont of Coriaria ruscifolia TaxID=1306542 RepID=UPI001041B4BE|nr:glycosyltransferase family 39 protein [Protofrankia symbiont of Coriaria ruscifolia]
MTDVAVRPVENIPDPAGAGLNRPDRAVLLFKAALFVVVVGAVAVRFSARQALWLDEAQSVAIARLPLTGPGTTLFDGLRQDGSPPLYYLLLHGWIELFGTGTSAVRALSALVNLAAAAPLYLLARRVVGARAAQVAVVLYLTSPFALYFATETRMYSLVVFLTATGGVALESTLRRRSAGSVVALALCAGMLALTHYWCFYLLFTVAGWLFLIVLRPRPGWGRQAPLAGLGGIAAGGLVFAPWLGGFFYQLAHTGTPWGEPATFAAIAHAYGQWAGGPTTGGRTLLFLVTGLAAAGVAGRAIDGRYVMIDLKGLEPGRTLFFLATVTLVVAVAAGKVVGNAWADRYTATAFVPFLLVIGLGLTVIVDSRMFRGIVLACALLGLAGGYTDLSRTRTQASETASILERLGHPGDVLLVCPDQLGPGLARTVPAWMHVYVVPTYAPPDRVDWTDYENRNTNANGVIVADRALAEAGPGNNVFLAGSGSYRTYETLCTQVRGRLADQRPRADEVMKQGMAADVWENFALLRFQP